MAFVASAFFAGVVGSFYAHYILILTPTSLFNLGIMVEIMAMTLMGGLGTFLGPVLVAFGLTVGLEYLRFLGDYRFITYGILLVLIVIFMPQGLGQEHLQGPGAGNLNERISPMKVAGIQMGATGSKDENIAKGQVADRNCNPIQAGHHLPARALHLPAGTDRSLR